MDNVNNPPPSNVVFNKTPLLVVRYEATGVIFERALAGDQITTDNIDIAMAAIRTFAVPDETEWEVELFAKDDDDEEFPEEAAEAEENLFEGSYWDDLIADISKEFERLDAPEEIDGFKLGDRVTYIGNERDFYEMPLNGLTATVVKLDNDSTMPIGLWFEDSIEGHNLDDVKSFTGKRGWYVESDEIEHHYEEIVVGDIVEIKSGDAEFDKFEPYYGEVVYIDDSDSYLVEWMGWNEGHDGNQGDGSKSRWWMGLGSITKA